MIGDWKNGYLCSEGNMNPVADGLITFSSIYNHCSGGTNTIDEDDTFEQFGYRSNDLSLGSHKKVVAVCDGCGNGRAMPFQRYIVTSGRCHSCAQIGENNSFYNKRHSEESKCKISENHADLSGENNPMYGIRICGEDHHLFGMHRSEEVRRKIAGNHADVSSENNPFYGRHHSVETKRKISADHQGCTYDEWEAFAINSPYCPAFNESCKESNREKYGRRCFLCDLLESDNITKTGKQKKLSVHHVDMNKNQGCDDHRWKLVPVCMHHHGGVHCEPWISRITYILENEAS